MTWSATPKPSKPKHREEKGFEPDRDCFQTARDTKAAFVVEILEDEVMEIDYEQDWKNAWHEKHLGENFKDTEAAKKKIKEDINKRKWSKITPAGKTILFSSLELYVKCSVDCVESPGKFQGMFEYMLQYEPWERFEYPKKRPNFNVSSELLVHWILLLGKRPEHLGHGPKDGRGKGFLDYFIEAFNSMNKIIPKDDPGYINIRSKNVLLKALDGSETNLNKNTILHEYAYWQEKSSEFFRTLLRNHRELRDERNAQYKTAFQIALERQNQAVALDLLENGCVVEGSDYFEQLVVVKREFMFEPAQALRVVALCDQIKRRWASPWMFEQQVDPYATPPAVAQDRNDCGEKWPLADVMGREEFIFRELYEDPVLDKNALVRRMIELFQPAEVRAGSESPVADQVRQFVQREVVAKTMGVDPALVKRFCTKVEMLDRGLIQLIGRLDAIAYEIKEIHETAVRNKKRSSLMGWGFGTRNVAIPQCHQESAVGTLKGLMVACRWNFSPDLPGVGEDIAQVASDPKFQKQVFELRNIVKKLAETAKSNKQKAMDTLVVQRPKAQSPDEQSGESEEQDPMSGAKIELFKSCTMRCLDELKLTEEEVLSVIEEDSETVKKFGNEPHKDEIGLNAVFQNKVSKVKLLEHLRSEMKLGRLQNWRKVSADNMNMSSSGGGIKRTPTRTNLNASAAQAQRSPGNYTELFENIVDSFLRDLWPNPSALLPEFFVRNLIDTNLQQWCKARKVGDTKVLPFDGAVSLSEIFYRMMQAHLCTDEDGNVGANFFSSVVHEGNKLGEHKSEKLFWYSRQCFEYLIDLIVGDAAVHARNNGNGAGENEERDDFKKRDLLQKINRAMIKLYPRHAASYQGNLNAAYDERFMLWDGIEDQRLNCDFIKKLCRDLGYRPIDVKVDNNDGTQAASATTDGPSVTQEWFEKQDESDIFDNTEEDPGTRVRDKPAKVGEGLRRILEFSVCRDPESIEILAFVCRLRFRLFPWALPADEKDGDHHVTRNWTMEEFISAIGLPDIFENQTREPLTFTIPLGRLCTLLMTPRQDRSAIISCEAFVNALTHHPKYESAEFKAAFPDDSFVTKLLTCVHTWITEMLPDYITLKVFPDNTVPLSLLREFISSYFRLKPNPMTEQLSADNFMSDVEGLINLLNPRQAPFVDRELLNKQLDTRVSGLAHVTVASSVVPEMQLVLQSIRNALDEEMKRRVEARRLKEGSNSRKLALRNGDLVEPSKIRLQNIAPQTARSPDALTKEVVQFLMHCLNAENQKMDPEEMDLLTCIQVPEDEAHAIRSMEGSTNLFEATLLVPAQAETQIIRYLDLDEAWDAMPIRVEMSPIDILYVPPTTSMREAILKMRLKKLVKHKFGAEKNVDALLDMFLLFANPNHDDQISKTEFQDALEKSFVAQEGGAQGSSVAILKELERQMSEKMNTKPFSTLDVIKKSLKTRPFLQAVTPANGEYEWINQIIAAARGTTNAEQKEERWENITTVEKKMAAITQWFTKMGGPDSTAHCPKFIFCNDDLSKDQMFRFEEEHLQTQSHGFADLLLRMRLWTMFDSHIASQKIILMNLREYFPALEDEGFALLLENSKCIRNPESERVHDMTTVSYLELYEFLTRRPERWTEPKGFVTSANMTAQTLAPRFERNQEKIRAAILTEQKPVSRQIFFEKIQEMTRLTMPELDPKGERNRLGEEIPLDVACKFYHGLFTVDTVMNIFKDAILETRLKEMFNKQTGEKSSGDSANDGGSGGGGAIPQSDVSQFLRKFMGIKLGTEQTQKLVHLMTTPEERQNLTPITLDNFKKIFAFKHSKMMNPIPHALSYLIPDYELMKSRKNQAQMMSKAPSIREEDLTFRRSKKVHLKHNFEVAGGEFIEYNHHYVDDVIRMLDKDVKWYIKIEEEKPGKDTSEVFDVIRMMLHVCQDKLEDELLYRLLDRSVVHHENPLWCSLKCIKDINACLEEPSFFMYSERLEVGRAKMQALYKELLTQMPLDHVDLYCESLPQYDALGLAMEIREHAAFFFEHAKISNYLTKKWIGEQFAKKMPVLDDLQKMSKMYSKALMSEWEWPLVSETHNMVRSKKDSAREVQHAASSGAAAHWESELGMQLRQSHQGLESLFNGVDSLHTPSGRFVLEFFGYLCLMLVYYQILFAGKDNDVWCEFLFTVFGFTTLFFELQGMLLSVDFLNLRESVGKHFNNMFAMNRLLFVGCFLTWFVLVPLGINAAAWKEEARRHGLHGGGGRRRFLLSLRHLKQQQSEQEMLNLAQEGPHFLPTNAMRGDLEPERLAFRVLSVGCLFLWTHLIRFLSIDRQFGFGPLIRVIVVMMGSIKDFFALYFVVMFGFAACFCFTWGDVSELKSHYGNLLGSVMTMFVSSLGNFDLGELWNIPNPAEAILAVTVMVGYLFFSMVLLLNMLIAILNSSYEDVSVKADAELGYAVADLTEKTLAHQEQGSLPPPFTLLSFPFTFSRSILTIFRRWAALHVDTVHKFVPVKPTEVKIVSHNKEYAQVQILPSPSVGTPSAPSAYIIYQSVGKSMFGGRKVKIQLSQEMMIPATNPIPVQSVPLYDMEKLPTEWRNSLRIDVKAVNMEVKEDEYHDLPMQSSPWFDPSVPVVEKKPTASATKEGGYQRLSTTEASITTTGSSKNSSSVLDASPAEKWEKSNLMGKIQTIQLRLVESVLLLAVWLPLSSLSALMYFLISWVYCMFSLTLDVIVYPYERYKYQVVQTKMQSTKMQDATNGVSIDEEMEGMEYVRAQVSIDEEQPESAANSSSGASMPLLAINKSTSRRRFSQTEAEALEEEALMSRDLTKKERARLIGAFVSRVLFVCPFYFLLKVIAYLPLQLAGDIFIIFCGRLKQELHALFGHSAKEATFGSFKQVIMQAGDMETEVEWQQVLDHILASYGEDEDEKTVKTIAEVALDLKKLKDKVNLNIDSVQSYLAPDNIEKVAEAEA